MGGRRSSGIRAKCPSCGREMAVYEPTSSPSAKRAEERMLRRDPTLTRFWFPAHPPGAREYCEGAISRVRVDDVVSIGGQTIEELVAEAEEGYDVSKMVRRRG